MQRRQARRIVEMLVSLAARDSFTVTGEGIETEEQWRLLARLGCDFGQGFLIARPMPADRMLAWLTRMTESGRYQRGPPP